MFVIKLGGSLCQSGRLLDILDKIRYHYNRHAVVIVPGGGAFADQVRQAQHQWHFGDITAHRMAILAMQQTALLINGIQPHFLITHTVDQVKHHTLQAQTVIWSPDLLELDQAHIAANWQITSDSLSVWLATQLTAQKLILIKSAIIDTQANLQQLTNHGIIDGAFNDFASKCPSDIHIINVEDFLNSDIACFKLTPKIHDR